LATILVQLVATSDLPGTQESLVQFAFATHCQFGESLEPSAFGDFRFCLKPVEEQFKLVGGDFPLSNAINQMAERDRGRLSLRILGMRRVAVKAAFQFGFEASHLGGVCRGDHTVSETAQLPRIEARIRLLRSRRLRFDLHVLHDERMYSTFQAG